jgi:hypothetical protein
MFFSSNVLIQKKKLKKKLYLRIFFNKKTRQHVTFYFQKRSRLIFGISQFNKMIRIFQNYKQANLDDAQKLHS